MSDPQKMVLMALLIGAIVGIVFNARVNPLNNYYIFMVIFAFVGMVAALIVLVVLYNIYEWLNR